MNRARLAQWVSLVTVVVVGAATYTVYGPSSPAITPTHYLDAGVSGPTHIATCPARIRPQCAATYGTRRYETLRFPVFVTGTPGNAQGFDVLLPPRSQSVAGPCIEVMAWADCTLEAVTAGTQAAALAYWVAEIPVLVARSSSSHVVPDCRGADGGWDDAHAPVACQRREPDGGSRWAGCNVMPRAQSVGGACLDAPTGVVYFGERWEDSL